MKSVKAKDYSNFLIRKSQYTAGSGFEPVFMPELAIDFQVYLIEWSLRTGRAGLFEDCGMGKTMQELTWAENIYRHTNKNVLLLTPLAVSMQTVREGEKFGIECSRSLHGMVKRGITITNYEQLHRFNPEDFGGIVCDESSILKNYDGKRKSEITEFMKKIPYRLLGTATAAPNDYTELGTSSEALGYLGHIDMLNRFFRNQNNTTDTKGHWRGTGRETRNGAHLHEWEGKNWRFKGHAEIPFWRYTCSWSRAMRRPSDLGFSDERFILPELTENEHVVHCESSLEGFLFPVTAVTLDEQRDERKRTIKERCEKVAELVEGHKSSLVWCHLNEEGNLLEEIIPRSIQVRGSHSVEYKESALLWFAGQECICNNPLFRSKVTTWRKEALNIGKNFIERIVNRGSRETPSIIERTKTLETHTVGSTTGAISINGKSEHPKNRQSITRPVESDMPLTKNSKSKRGSSQKNTGEKILPQSELKTLVNTDSASSNSSLCSEVKTADVQFADSQTEATQGDSLTSITVTKPEECAESSAPLVTLDSESSETIQSYLEKHGCICGHKNGVRRLITKPKIAGLGMNFQDCSHVTFFPSHSYEQYYQGVRRCWRFGQKNPVTVDIVTTEGERGVLKNLKRKAAAADRMFSNLVAEMKNELHIQRGEIFTKREKVPSWLETN